MDAYLSEQLATAGIPGAAAVVVQDGRPVHQAAFGRADDTGRPMTVRTPVLLASASKSLTAIAVMQQVEAGRLDLDAPVQRYLPWFTVDDPRTGDITVRHLLHQSSGLSTADGSGFESSDSQAPEALEQAVRNLAGAELVAAPGEVFTYSNDNYLVLGLLVQEVSGRPFGDYLEQQVFAPLDMAHAHTTRAEAEADGKAAGHSLWYGTFWRQTHVPASTAGMPSTTLYASAEDIGHELAALLNGGRYRDRTVLQPGSVETLLAPAVRVDDVQQYAMGWFARPLAESADPAADSGPGAGLPLLLEHHGEWGNTHIYQGVVPQTGLGVAIVLNASDPNAPSRLKGIDSNVLRILHGQEPVAPRIFEDPLQRYAWAVALALLFAELASLAASLILLRHPRRPVLLGGVAVVALAVDAALLWLCLGYVPDRFAVPLVAILRHIPDVGTALVPALVLAVAWPVPRTLLLAGKIRHARRRDAPRPP